MVALFLTYRHHHTAGNQIKTPECDFLSAESALNLILLILLILLINPTNFSFSFLFIYISFLYLWALRKLGAHSV